MAATDTAGPSPASRKIRWLGIVVVVVVALYSAGWFYVASKIENFLNGAIGQNATGSLNVQCDKLTTSGFPFLIGFSCDRTVVGDIRTGNMISAGAFSVAARIYNPGMAVAELKGPADIMLEDGGSIQGTWDLLHASFRANLSGLSTLSSEGKVLKIQLNSPVLADTLNFAAQNGQLHMRNNSGDLDVAASAEDFLLTDSANTELLPKLSTSIDMLLGDRGNVLEGARFDPKGMAGTVRSFKIATADGIYGELSGHFTTDVDGYMTGTFKAKLEKLDLWEQRLRVIFPEAGDTISALSALLRGLAKGKDEVSVKIKVQDGDISLSFVPLGKIPPF